MNFLNFNKRDQHSAAASCSDWHHSVPDRTIPIELLTGRDTRPGQRVFAIEVPCDPVGLSADHVMWMVVTETDRYGFHATALPESTLDRNVRFNLAGQSTQRPSRLEIIGHDESRQTMSHPTPAERKRAVENFIGTAESKLSFFLPLARNIGLALITAQAGLRCSWNKPDRAGLSAADLEKMIVDQFLMGLNPRSNSLALIEAGLDRHRQNELLISARRDLETCRSLLGANPVQVLHQMPIGIHRQAESAPAWLTVPVDQVSTAFHMTTTKQVKRLRGIGLLPLKNQSRMDSEVGVINLFHSLNDCLVAFQQYSSTRLSHYQREELVVLSLDVTGLPLGSVRSGEIFTSDLIRPERIIAIQPLTAVANRDTAQLA